MHLKHVFCQINADSRNVPHGSSCRFKWLLDTSTLAQLMPCRAGAPMPLNPVTPTIDFLHVFLLPTGAKPHLVTSVSVAWSQIWSQLDPDEIVFYLRRDSGLTHWSQSYVRQHACQRRT
jgi:hypothetical protein